MRFSRTLGSQDCAQEGGGEDWRGQTLEELVMSLRDWVRSCWLLGLWECPERRAEAWGTLSGQRLGMGEVKQKLLWPLAAMSEAW